jgi:phosphatidylglycerol---prolipoprotein diacylglyceryl transferase
MQQILPLIDPIAFKLGPLNVHWYGLMYLISFILASVAMRYRIKKYVHYKTWAYDNIDDLIFYCIIGVVFGGRLGYVFFYQWSYYSQNFADIIKIWQGGMSFHGGLLGVLLACLMYGVFNKRKFFEITDFIAPIIPIGLFFGRLGNFINGELWGRITTSRFGMVFPSSLDGLTRHPSQIYQMLSEGLLLGIIMWVYLHKPRILGTASGLFLFFYGCLRFYTEIYREPDAFLGLQTMGLTMGQILCIPMIIIGALILATGEIKHIAQSYLAKQNAGNINDNDNGNKANYNAQTNIEKPAKTIKPAKPKPINAENKDKRNESAIESSSESRNNE